MKKIIEADQTLPYNMAKSKLFHRAQFRELLYIAIKNRPDLSAEEVIEMFQSLSHSGCSCAFLANALVDQLSLDEQNFTNTFGFSLFTGTGKMDSNKLMVDIFSKLYGVMKVKFIEYDFYAFDSAEEASKALLGKTFLDNSDAFLNLFDAGYAADGLDNNGKLLFKSREPKLSYALGTCEQIAKEKFGIEGIKTLENLQNICFNNNITMEYSDLEIHDKLTGLGTSNFNFWSNYYLKQYGVDFQINNEAIITSDFHGDYEKFMGYINDLLENGYTISIAAPNNTETYIHSNMPMSYTKITSQEAGHIMKLKGFNNNKDFVVSSYGKEFILDKEYFPILEFQKINTIPYDVEQITRG